MFPTKILRAMTSVYTPVRKRLVICCDGTWQSSVSGKRNIPSNVTRLARAIAKAGKDQIDGKEWQQVVYYDSGVGTGSLWRLEAVRQGATGDGLVVNVLEAYNFLVNNYAPGDQIFCFGFSRGAFTAKAIAGLVSDIGVFKPQNMQYFAPLFAAYQQNTAKHEFRKTKAYFEFVNGRTPMVPEADADKPYVREAWETAHRDLSWPNSHTVQVVGCFDTVGSLGKGDTYIHSHADDRRRFEFLNVKLSPYIKHAFHALALDEHRQPFLPTLWYIPNKETIRAENAKLVEDHKNWKELQDWRAKIDKELEVQRNTKPDLRQVWFTGVHINVGGGSDAESLDSEGLSNVTYAWMVEQCRPYLAFEDWNWTEDGIAGYFRQVIDEQRGWEQHDKHEPTWKDKAWSAFSTLNITSDDKSAKLVPARNVHDYPGPSKHDPQPVHRWGTSQNEDSYTALYRAIKGPVNRMPGESKDQSTEDLNEIRHLGITNEYIHPTVKWRYDDKQWGYKSKPLEGWKRTPNKDKQKGWQPGYLKEATGLWLPEWRIEPEPEGQEGVDGHQSAEWLMINNCSDATEVKKWLRDVDREWKEATVLKKSVEVN